MILTCDRKIIDIYFGIDTIEVVIQTIISTIVIVIFTTITPIFVNEDILINVMMF